MGRISRASLIILLRQTMRLYAPINATIIPRILIYHWWVRKKKTALKKLRGESGGTLERISIYKKACSAEAFATQMNHANLLKCVFAQDTSSDLEFPLRLHITHHIVAVTIFYFYSHCHKLDLEKTLYHTFPLNEIFAFFPAFFAFFLIFEPTPDPIFIIDCKGWGEWREKRAKRDESTATGAFFCLGYLLTISSMVLCLGVSNNRLIGGQLMVIMRPLYTKKIR